MPQNDQIWPKIDIFGQFGPGHAGLFNALLCVGWWLWRAGCISQDTYLLYIIDCYIYQHLVDDVQPSSLISMLPQQAVSWFGNCSILIDHINYYDNYFNDYRNYINIIDYYMYILAHG